MSNMIFMLGVVTLANTQREVPLGLSLILVALGILADIFGFIDVGGKK